ncbi:MAG: succinate dehydrogenase assembly factor 2 [Gammaproteobacteria bacterium]|nr:succinate dehydrogenase assembly factor 2 [Gammaproteobacteria bacterium]MDE0450704.1 succinate dehydrogenase assembly factor 2 [Gammaproteobacteria bacterium]
MDEGQELRRVRWRSRRGMLELDLFLVPFAESCYSDLSPADRAAFRHLLDREDWEILDWLRQDCAPAPGLAGIVKRVRRAACRPVP